MDTRSKIVTAARLHELRPLAVTGYFDVLTVDLIREFQRIRANGPEAIIAAIVLPCGDQLLGQRARAEMTAALAVIDYVLIAESEDSEALLAEIEARASVRLEAADRDRNRKLREHVRRRHSL